MRAWFNGAFVDGGARLDIADRGFLLGDGAFETLAVVRGCPAFLGEHLTRLRGGLRLLEIREPEGLADVGAVIEALAVDASGPYAARITVSRGPAGRGLDWEGAAASPSLLVALSPAAPQSGSALLHVSARRRYSGASVNAFKSIGGYTENMLARREARRAGADDALLLNEHGRPACATAANLFLMAADGAVATPSLREGATPGIVRGLLIARLAALGVAVAERGVDAAEMDGAFLFLTNSLIGLRPAALLGARPAAPPPLFDGLADWYRRRLEEETMRSRAPS